MRALFATPTLAALAATVGRHREVVVPPNVITADDKTITPEMLPLVELTQADIDRIVAQVPGGVANIQDIYPLSPLQEGILFHHLLASAGRSVPVGEADGVPGPVRCWTDIWVPCSRWWIGTTSCGRRSCGKGSRSRRRWCGGKAPLAVTEVELEADGTGGSEQLAGGSIRGSTGWI